MPDEPSKSSIFELLASRRRRILLRALRDSRSSLTVGEIADRIGDREYANPTHQDHQTLTLELSHNHLPRLDAASVVVWDRDEGTVRPGANFDAVVRVLERGNNGTPTPSSG